MKILISFLLFLLLVACSPQKKLQRLLNKYPELTAKEIITIRDTIRDTIKVEVPGVATSKGFTIEELKDTVYIDSNQLHIVIYSKGDSIFVEGACDTVFVQVPYEKIITRKIPVDKIFYRKPRDKLRFVVFAFLAGFVSYFILQLVVKKRLQNQIP